MAIVKPFQCIRPKEELASKVAALPYDVYNREEAKEKVQQEPLSFLRIDRAETTLDDTIDSYDSRVYEKAKEIFEKYFEEGIFVTEKEACYYIYELVMDGRSQTGIVACAAVDDYLNNVIKKHENTREDKELDRITHVDTLSAQTGPIFLAYRSQEIINEIVNRVKEGNTLFDFTADDGVVHRVWKVMEENLVERLQWAFEQIQDIYIADGHHRAASAVKVGLKKREGNPNHTGSEEYNFFLSVLFPDDQLMIMDYNRCVKDLNGWTEDGFFEKIEEYFHMQCFGEKSYKPEKKGSFGMYISGKWYRLDIKEEFRENTDVVDSLDVSLLQKYLLGPILGIENPRTSNRIAFIGGIRGLEELKKRADEDMKVSFALYPTSIQELFSVADADKLMPPKSTWFEPKLRSGLFIHRF